MLMVIPSVGYDIPGPPPRVRRPEEVGRPLTDYEKQLLREIQDFKNRQEVMVAPAPPPPKYSDTVENWQKGRILVLRKKIYKSEGCKNKRV